MDVEGGGLAGLATPVTEGVVPFNSELVDPQGLHRSDNVLPGWNGVPFRGPVPNLKEGDPDEKQPKIAMQAHVDIFVLSVPDHLKKYESVIQLVANGFAAISAEERMYDESIKSWRVFIRWVQYYSFVEKGK